MKSLTSLSYVTFALFLFALCFAADASDFNDDVESLQDPRLDGIFAQADQGHLHTALESLSALVDNCRATKDVWMEMASKLQVGTWRLFETIVGSNNETERGRALAELRDYVVEGRHLGKVLLRAIMAHGEFASESVQEVMWRLLGQVPRNTLINEELRHWFIEMFETMVEEETAGVLLKAPDVLASIFGAALNLACFADTEAALLEAPLEVDDAAALCTFLSKLMKDHPKAINVHRYSRKLDELSERMPSKEVMSTLQKFREKIDSELEYLEYESQANNKRMANRNNAVLILQAMNEFKRTFMLHSECREPIVAVLRDLHDLPAVETCAKFLQLLKQGGIDLYVFLDTHIPSLSDLIPEVLEASATNHGHGPSYNAVLFARILGIIGSSSSYSPDFIEMVMGRMFQAMEAEWAASSPVAAMITAFSEQFDLTKEREQWVALASEIINRSAQSIVDIPKDFLALCATIMTDLEYDAFINLLIDTTKHTRNEKQASSFVDLFESLCASNPIPQRCTQDIVMLAHELWQRREYLTAANSSVDPVNPVDPVDPAEQSVEFPAKRANTDFDERRVKRRPDY